MACVAFLVVLLATLLPAGRVLAQTRGLDPAAIARAVVARMGLKRSEKVLWVGRPGVFDTLTALIRAETRRAGIRYTSGTRTKIATGGSRRR